MDEALSDLYMEGAHMDSAVSGSDGEGSAILRLSRLASFSHEVAL